MAPQIVFLVWLFLNALIVASLDGKPRADPFNFGQTLLRDLLLLILLYWGGFFNPLFVK